MLSRISFLVLLGCFLPIVLSRPPSVSLQNDGYGSYNFQYDVSHPKGSSRGHMRFGSKNGGDHPSHSQLSPAPHADSYRAEKEARHPQDYPAPDSSEHLHDPRPIYPSPYDSSEKQQNSYDVPSSYHGAPSAPEANYHHPQTVYDGPSNSYDGVKTAQPISQVSVPAFSGHGEEVKPVPVGPNYQFIPDGPPYVVNSHSAEIVHPPLPNDQLVQKPVELAAPVLVQQPVELAPPHPVVSKKSIELPPPHPVVPQQHVEVAPPHPVLPQQPIELAPPHPVVPQQPIQIAPLPKESVYMQEPMELFRIPKQTLQEPVELSPPVVQQSVDLPHEPVPYVLPEVSAASAVKQPPSLSLAFQLPIQKPVVSSPKVDDIQLSHNDEPVLVPSDLPHQPISHDLSDDVHSPVSHSLRLPVLTPSPEISSGPSAAAIEAVPELGHIGGSSSPLSHSTRLLLPGPSGSPLGHGPLDEPVNSLGVDSSLNGPIVSPPSHAFRLTLPGALKPVGSSSAFSEVETPDVPQLPQLSHAFRLNLPSHGSYSNNPSVEYFPEDSDASLLALESKL